MSRKDYALIAAVIAETRNIEATSRQLYAVSFADALASTNPLFDRSRFMAACLRHDPAKSGRTVEEANASVTASAMRKRTYS